MNLKSMLMPVAFAGLIPSAAMAAGFQINEHSAPATGRAGAVVATIDDPSAVFHNPAGLAQSDKKDTRIQVGLTLIRPRGEYQGAGFESTRPAGETSVIQPADSPFVPIPNAYLARKLSEKAYVGFGFYAPYGLGISWADPENFVGRTVVQELSLRTFFLTPAIALKLSDDISVAVSVSLVPSTLYLKRVLGATDNGQVLFPKSTFGSEGTVELAGSAFGVGANAGVQFRVIEHLRFGLAFRSAVGLDFSGRAHFDIPETATPSLQNNFPDGDVTGELTLPHSFLGGIGWVDGPLTIEASARVTLWQSYDELRISFKTEKPAKSSVSPRDWQAAPTFVLGGQYTFAEAYTARLGVGYDVTPVPDTTIDPTLPDADRFLFTAGFGAKFDPISIDVSYMGLILGTREAPNSVNFPGTYNGGMVHLLGVSAGVEF